MSQNNLPATPLDPNAISGSQLASYLGTWRDAVHSGHAGAARPSYAITSMVWVKTVSATAHELYYYDGTDDILLGTVNPTANTFTPTLPDGSVTAAKFGSTALGDALHAATAKTTLSNADEFSIWDSVAAIFKKVTYQNLLANILSGVVSTVNNWTKSQAGAIVTLTDAATIAVDLSLANNFKVTLAGNRTLGNPTNIVAGQSGVIAVTQDATGSRTLAFSSYYKFAGGTAPTLTTTANAVDYLSYYVETTTRILIAPAKDVK